MNVNHEKMIAEFMNGESSGRELLELCRHDRELLNELAELTVMERLLAHQEQDANSELFAAEIKAVLSRGNESDAFVLGVRNRLAKEEQVSRVRWTAVLPGVLKLAAAALVVFSVYCWMYVNRPVAVLTNTAAADWNDKAVGVEQVFKRGIVDLKAGCAELRFCNNVAVLLEGPARLRIK